MKRVYETAAHFDIPCAIIINKWDLNKENSEDIENFCKEKNVKMVGKISYNRAVIDAVNLGIPIVSYSNQELSNELKDSWQNICDIIA
jgi:MinD superfamily P-loop ATPase